MINTQAIRHLSDLDTTPFMNRVVKSQEELGEMAAAALVAAASPNASASADDNLLEEATDVVICALDVLFAAGYQESQIVQMIDTKCRKWARKQNTLNALKVERQFSFVKR